MSETHTRLTREDIAKLEIGHTDVTGPRKWTLILAFLAVITVVPAVQQVLRFRTERSPAEIRVALSAGDGLFARVLKTNRVLLRDMHGFEDALARDSWLTRALIPPVQAVLSAVFRVGNESVYTGVGDWLFYRPDIDHLIGPPFLDPKVLEGRVKAAGEWENQPTKGTQR